MPLPVRRRIFVILVTMAAVPTTLAVVAWVLSLRVVAPAAGARASLEQVNASARAMLQRVDTTRLSPGARLAVRRHLEEISNSVSLARRGDAYLQYLSAGLAVVIVVLGGLVLFSAIRVAGHLSRQLSRPIDELVGWTQLIKVREPLPAGAPVRGAPEFEALRQALRDLAGALDAARERELDAHRRRSTRSDSRTLGQSDRHRRGRIIRGDRPSRAVGSGIRRLRATAGR